MRNPFGALMRLFGRSHNPVIAALYTHAIGKPLLVEPSMGERLIAAYMHGGVESPGPMVADSPASGVGILTIRGGLASRPEPGLCDDGPAHYQGIRAAFDQLLADENVTAIVLDLESPGGMVSGCFDLTDHIHASRGQKPIIAAVNDYAYSAAYAIASACDEIWITRTGGVGSVGVVGYHIDQTGYNEKMGIKVTPIYAGAHKVDRSPHRPLSEDAKSREQAEVDGLYDLFVGSVAKYRGMDADAVRATEALTYTGQAAIDVGFADRIGTLDDVLASLSESDEQRQAREQREAVENAEHERKMAADDRVAAAALVVSADLPGEIVTSLLDKDSGITAESVQARIQHALAVTDLCVAYGDRSLARDYIVRNTNIEVVRDQLQAAKASDGPEIDTTPSADISGKSALALWGNTIKKFGGNPQ
jgi:signal peptide peptidase SppA